MRITVLEQQWKKEIRQEREGQKVRIIREKWVATSGGMMW